MSITPQEAQAVMDQAECLINSEEINAAFDRMADAINTEMVDDDPLCICIMNGGLNTAGYLLTRLNFPVQVDYLHATRYRGDISGGENVLWKARPQQSIVGRNVLLIDDLLDEGKTLVEIERWCLSEGANSVKIAVLAEKIHDRRAEGARFDYCGLQVPDRYIFGFGLDYKEYWRNANGIYAIRE